MTIELDNLIDLLGKIEDIQNLTATQESNLLQVENAVTRYHAAKTKEDKANYAIELDAAASVDGERAASLSRAMGTMLSDLHADVESLITDNEEAEHE